MGVSSGKKEAKKIVKWEELTISQQKAFSLDGRVKVLDWLIDGISNDPTSTRLNAGHKPYHYDKKEVDKNIEIVLRGGTNTYEETDEYLYKCFEKFPIKGKTIAIIGSTGPWYEAVCLAYGGIPTVIEYNKITSNDKRLKFLSVEEYDNNPQKFDAVLSVSSYEHDGLGRYGDPIDPDGDLKSMTKLREKMLKDDGVLYLSVPVGKDTLIWNAHRIYGLQRYPMLIEGFRIIHTEGLTEVGYDVNGHFMPYTILKNQHWCWIEGPKKYMEFNMLFGNVSDKMMNPASIMCYQPVVVLKKRIKYEKS